MSFDVAAQAYDEFMGRWSRLLAPQLADLAGVRTGLRVLDVGCGPGALTAELATRLGPASVTAVDPSPPFVAAARARNPGVDVRQSAAEHLPFPDGTFDAALAQLVVHFMVDPVAGLAEMARVTRQGGVAAACVWDYAGGHGPLGPFWLAARVLDAGVEDESRLVGTRAGHLAQLFETAGLRVVQQTALSVSRDHADFDSWWEPVYTRGGSRGLLRVPSRRTTAGRAAGPVPLHAPPRSLHPHRPGLGRPRRRLSDVARSASLMGAGVHNVVELPPQDRDESGAGPILWPSLTGGAINAQGGARVARQSGKSGKIGGVSFCPRVPR